jgi:flagellar capping protein FliD
MSLKDRVAKANESRQVRDEEVKERWKNFADAYNLLFKSIKSMLDEAAVRFQEHLTSVRDSTENKDLDVRNITFKRGGFSVQIYAQSLSAQGSSVVIQGGATTAETRLYWNGTGSQLSDWSVLTPSGSSEPLNEQRIEDALAKHLGV